jgi:hypothetical protein
MMGIPSAFFQEVQQLRFFTQVQALNCEYPMSSDTPAEATSGSITPVSGTGLMMRLSVKAGSIWFLLSKRDW